MLVGLRRALYKNTRCYPFNPERIFFSKIMFKRPFPNFLLTTEVDFQEQNFQVVITIKPEHLTFEFRKFVFQFSDHKQIAIFRQNRRQIFSDKKFDQSLQLNLNICRLNFEIGLISSQVISKKPLPVKTGSRFSATTIFGHYFYRT